MLLNTPEAVRGYREADENIDKCQAVRLVGDKEVLEKWIQDDVPLICCSGK